MIQAEATYRPNSFDPSIREIESGLAASPETLGDVLQAVERRLVISDATDHKDESGTTQDATDFVYPKNYVDTELPLGKYMSTNASVPTSAPALIKRDIAGEYLAQHPEYTEGWWLHPEDLSKYTHDPIFSDMLPQEQFLVGQDRKVRFFNFGAPLSEARQADCQRFVDIYTQYLGDRAYDSITDVVIAEFSEDRKHIAGYAYIGSGLLLINTAVLPDEAPKEEGVEGSSFLQTLVHEGGHLLHGKDEDDQQADEHLTEFAQAIGWDMRGMKRDRHDWKAKGADNSAYAPHVMTPLVVIAPPGGVPNEYATENPRESSAETTKHAMLGGAVLNIMPATVDAWLTHVQNRVLKPGETPADRPIATSINRQPITAERRVGNEIVYPHTLLPETISIRAIPESK